MYKTSKFTKPVYSIGEVADLLGVTTQTIRCYGSLGKLRVIRSDGGHRRIMREDLLKFLSDKNMLLEDSHTQKRDVIYARVSSYEQEVKGDLDRQVIHVIESIPDLKNPLVLKEVGSGLNDRRKQLHTLIKLVMEQKVNNVYVTYQDRLTRFGYHYLETVFLCNGVRIIVLNDKGKNKDIELELVEDMMALIASFSDKLYGMRSRKNKTEN